MTQICSHSVLINTCILEPEGAGVGALKEEYGSQNVGVRDRKVDFQTWAIQGNHLFPPQDQRNARVRMCVLVLAEGKVVGALSLPFKNILSTAIKCLRN